MSETWNVHITNSEGIDQHSDSKVDTSYIIKYEDNDFIYYYEEEAYKEIYDIVRYWGSNKERDSSNVKKYSKIGKESSKMILRDGPFIDNIEACLTIQMKEYNIMWIKYWNIEQQYLSTQRRTHPSSIL